MKVLHVMSCCTVGGCEQHVLTLLRNLPSDRYERWLTYFEEQPDSADVMVDDFRAAGVQTVDLAARSRNDLGAVWRLGALLRRERFDIVHTHSLRAELATAFWAPTVEHRPKLIREFHNTDPLYDHPISRRLGRWSAGRMDAFIAISSAVSAFIQPRIGRRANEIHQIYYGLDASAYPYDRPRQPGTMRLGIVARLAAQKGYHVLLEAVKEIASSVPQVSLVAIGHEDDLTLAELESYARQLGIRERVQFLGFRSDLATLLSDVDIFVLPSLWEGFGLVLLEAMALGVPVVASKVGPIPEVVESERTGRLVPPGNPQALASAIVELLSNPELALQLSRSARQRVEERFGLDTMIASTEALYEQLLAPRSVASIAQ